MDIRIHCQGISGSPWMNEFFEHKLETIERYLPSHFQIDISIESTHARFEIMTPRHEYIFEDDGCDSYNAFMNALEVARRALSQDHRRLVEKYHRLYFES